MYVNLISDFHKAIMEEIIYDYFEFDIPAKMGFIHITKSKFIRFLYENGNLFKVNLLVDWLDTLLLWKEDEESRLNKKLVRHLNYHTNGYISKLVYS